MMGGQAIAEALVGQYTPSGRLPYSVYTTATIAVSCPTELFILIDACAVFCHYFCVLDVRSLFW